jgi:hypothetical protein
MLFDTHTVSKCKKMYRNEARKIFVREVAKNLFEREIFENKDANKPDSPGDQYNLKLLQNYGAL